MLYSEFVKGTGCKETEYNYEVYKDLEIMYMNSNMSKEKIYEYGKKLVDNSKTEKEIALEEEVKGKIKARKECIKENNKDIKAWKTMLEVEEDHYWIENWKYHIKVTKQANKRLRTEIRELKWVLA